MTEQDELSPQHEPYLRRELQRGLEQLDRGEYASFNAESIIAEERQRMDFKTQFRPHPRP